MQTNIARQVIGWSCFVTLATDLALQNGVPTKVDNSFLATCWPSAVIADQRPTRNIST